MSSPAPASGSSSGSGSRPELTGLNPSTALATVLVDELVRLGLTDACLAPGSRSAPLALALEAHPGVRLHVVIDERSAAFLALGLARATGVPAAVVTTSGSAVVNLHPAVVEAGESRVPLLVLTADRPPELRGTGANQTIDQIKVFGDTVRWFCEVGVAEDRPGVVAYWRAVACQAWARALAGPAGPVHCNLAFRDPLVPPAAHEPDAGKPPFSQSLDGRADGRPWARLVRGTVRAPEAEVERLAARIAATERGVLVLGETATPPGPLLALAEAAGWPVLAEPLSGARSGPNAISTYATLLAHAPFARQQRPDLVIRVGRVALSKALLGWLGGEVPQVLIDPDGAWLDPGRTLSDLVVADPGALATALVDRLVDRLPERPDAGWLRDWWEAERLARAALDDFLDAQEAPTEPGVARDLAAALPEGATLVVASSMPVRDLDLAMAPRTGLRVLGNRGASGIDGFVSTALGVALGAGGGPVAALTGDLSLLHDQNGFLLDGLAEVDLPIVVVNNDGGGIFSFLPQADLPQSFERLFGTPHGRDLSLLARFHGLGYTRLERARDLPEVLEGRGVRLIEVRTDRTANRALHASLRRISAT